MLVGRVLLSTLAVSAFGQVPRDPYKNIKEAVWLTENQLWQLEQNRKNTKPIEQRPPSGGPAPAERRASNSEVSVGGPELLIPDDLSFLYPSQRDRLAQIASVLDRRATAAAAIFIGVISERDFPGGTWCDRPSAVYASEFDLNDVQISQFEALRNSPERPPPSRAMPLLTNVQKAKVEAFLADLELAEEAIAIGLLPRPSAPEGLCM